MDTETSGLWWLVAIVTGAIGTGMLVYAIRQKDPVPLVFGIGISIIPMLASSGWASALLALAAGGLFIAVRKLR